MRTDELEFDLSPELIAAQPAVPRESARLFVYHRSRDAVEHRRISDLPQYVSPGDHLVRNETRVLPARLSGVRTDTGRAVAGLFLDEPLPGEWRVLLERSRRLRAGMRIALGVSEGEPTAPVAELELLERDQEAWRARVTPVRSAQEILAEVGRMPLPPYILKRRMESGLEVEERLDRVWYQTAFARDDAARSIAAPTAGLHLTSALCAEIEQHGARWASVVLDVGEGTFRPVTVEHLEAHRMHAERIVVPSPTLHVLHERKRTKQPRIWAIGTTTVRTLESLPDPLPPADRPYAAETSLCIMPPYHMKHVDVLLTNFHLPRSTLLALVAAMTGLERLHALYREAVREKYRFFSYGDAMLIL